MATSATQQTTNHTGISSKSDTIKIYKDFVKKSFSQTPNWLLRKIVQKLPAKEHQAWCLLSWFLSLKPDTVLTPKIVADQTGHSERSIYTYMSYLIEVGHVKATRIRDKDARFITTTYEVFLKKFFWRNKDTNMQVVDIVNKNTYTNLQKGEIIANNVQKQVKKGIDTNANLQKGEIISKKDNSYKRARAHMINLGSNTSSSSNTTESGQDKSNPEGVAAATLLNDIEVELEDCPSIDPDLVSRCLENFGPEYTLGAIKLSKIKVPHNPGAFFNGASKTKYSSVGACQKPQPSEQAKTMSENNFEVCRNAFLESIFNEECFHHYLELSDEDLKSSDRFKKFAASKGYEL